MKLNVLQKQLAEMEHYIHLKSQCNSAVSNAPVGWHLSHNLKVINNIIIALESSRPEDYRQEFNFLRIMVFLTRKIPRGRAQAPMVVHPPDHITREGLHDELTEAERKIKLLANMDKKAFFRHPYFKDLNRDQTKKFLEIHTAHHLKIIREILK